MANALPPPKPLDRASVVDWKTFGLLAVIAVIASVAVVPYLLEVMRALGDTSSTVELVSAALLERVVLSVVAICVGMILAPQIGFAGPLCHGGRIAVTDQDQPGEQGVQRRSSSWLIAGILGGISVAFVIYSFDPFLEAALMPPWPEQARRAEEIAAQMPTWKPLLASFSAGVTEELWFRFCAMTLFAWLGCRMTRRSEPGSLLLWTANLLAALLFGLLHLTNVIQLGIPVTPGAVVYVVIWNGLAGLVFGWLYWRQGLVTAMLAHTVADVALKVVIPMIETALA